MMSVAFDIETYEDEFIDEETIMIDGEPFDLKEGITKVMIAGPVDRQTCLACLQYTGRIFNADDPEIQPFFGEGLHPNCRHFAEPLLMSGPASDKLVDRGRDVFVNAQLSKMSYADKVAVLGKEKTKLYDEGMIAVDDLYREDGTVKPLKEMKVK